MNADFKAAPHPGLPFSMLRVCVKFPVAVAVLAALGAALWIGPSSAQAACGDYVHLGGGIELDKPASHSAGLDAPEHSAWQSQIPLVPPCDGPNCRRQAPAPELPVPVSPTSGPDHKAHLAHAEIA